MMEIEKKLALADLKTYHEDQKWRTLAKEIVQYQNFRAAKACKKISGDWQLGTKKNHFNIGLRYMRNKIRDGHMGNKFYNFIDEAIQQHVQPLTPSISDKAHPRKPRSTQPVERPHFDIPKQLTQPFEYGIRYKNNIAIADEQAATNFINICKSLGIDGVRVVTITVEEEK